MNRNTIDTIVWWIPFRKIRNAVRIFFVDICNVRYKEEFGVIEPQTLTRTLLETIERTINLTTEIKNTAKQKEVVKRNLKHVEIEISSFCNRKCFFCPNSLIDRYTQNIELEEEFYLKVIKELAEIDYSYGFCFHRYNEPLVNKELILKRIRQAREYLPNSLLQIFTNGDYLTREYLDDLRLADLNQIRMTCYLNKNEDFDLENIVKPKMNKILEKLSLDYEELLYNSSFYYGLRLKYDGLDIVYQAVDYTKCYGTDRGGLLKDMSSPNRTIQCLNPFSSINIDFNGNFMPCCNIRSDSEEHKRYILGNIRDNTIFEIFTNKKASSFRVPIGIGEYGSLPPCKQCIDTNGNSSRLF